MKKAFSNHEWLGCSAHNLQLVLQWSLNQKEPKITPDPAPVITSLLDTIKSIVSTVKRTGINQKLETRLRQACPTRWDSNYDMCQSVVDNLEQLDNESSLAAMMDAIPRGLLKELCQFLKPFKDMRMILCSDKAPTMHVVILAFHKLKNHIEGFKTKNLSMMAIKKQTINYLVEKFKLTPLHYIATFLFPKYRSTEPPLTKLKGEGMEKLRSLMGEITESDNEENSAVPYYDEPNVSTDVFGQFVEKPVTNTSTDEIEGYKNLILTPNEFGQDFCPFKFWFNHKEEFPKLSSIAEWLLSAPATSCASERNFSTAGRIMDQRNRLLPSSLDNLLFIKSNKDIAN